jgi:hypothetical protein
MSESIGNPEFVPVAEAAGTASLPVRTVYNWVESESIESRQRDGVTVVRIDEVMARANESARLCRRKAPQLPALALPANEPAGDAGIDASPSPPSISSAALPTDLFAHLIGLLEKGMALQTIVQELHLSPELALEAKRQYDRLVAASGQPSLLEQFNSIAQRLEGRMDQLESRMAEIEHAQAALTQHAAQEVCDALSPWQSQVQKQLTEMLNRLDQRQQQQLESAISKVSESLSRHRLWVCDLLSQHFRSV